MNWFINKIENYGEQISVIFNDNKYSYSQLALKIKFYFDEVKNKIDQGAVVAIKSDYNFESIALFFALSENKNVIVPITTNLLSEIEQKLNVAGCSYSVSISEDKLNYEELENTAKEHKFIQELQKLNASGLILFSSGSTGTPKAMIHNLDEFLNSFSDKKNKNLVFLIFLMFDHIGGLNTLLNCLSMGVTMVFPTDRDPEKVCSLIQKYKVNILPTSPTFLNLIYLNQSFKRYDLSSLKMITYGTEPMPESLLVKLKDVFPKARFLQTFGTSETGISQTTSKSSTSTLIKIDDPNTEYKIVKGELWIKSKTQIIGYLNSSMERFTDEGWFKTGDLVEESDDGYLKIVGRNSEIINVGGEKVLPSEVESVLFQMPGIKDCIVFGEISPITGQIVVAKILPDKNESALEIKKRIIKFCNDKLDRYKIPVKVIKMEHAEYSERYKKKRN